MHTEPVEHMKSRYTILLTNDDSYVAPGIKHLYDVLKEHHDVVVVAPQEEQSGIGHAFTFNKPLSYACIPQSAGLPGYMVAGTPSDCVKFAISFILKHKPDIVISGINSGENSGISGFYSGTVAAAREGAFWRIPSFAFSISGGDTEHYIGYAGMALDVLDKVMATTQPEAGEHQVYYNVNFPLCLPAACKGIRVTKQSLAFFDDRYKRVESNDDRENYIIYGEKKDVEDSDSFDSRALINNYTTITPLSYDATAHWSISGLSSLER